MIKLENVTKIYRLEGKAHVVADNLNLTFPSGTAVGLLGGNGAGKSTLLKLISGTEVPTSGRVIRHGSVSWPVGFAGSFHPDLTGQQNTRFIARVYGVDTNELSEFVEDFADIGEHYYLPFYTYSSGMRSRLAFGVSMGIPFDTYLVDEVTAVGDATFRARSTKVFLDRMKGAGAVFVSHSMGQIRELCQAVVVLRRGQAVYYEDVEAGIAHHMRNMGV